MMILQGVRPEHVRFAVSPLRECLRGIDVLLHPAKHAEQMPWVRQARRRLPRDLRRDIEAFRFLFEPSPPRNAGSFEAYRDAVLRRHYGKPLMERSEIEALRRKPWPLDDSAARSYAKFSGMLAQFQASVFEPSWQPIEARLRADVAMRKRILAEYGVAALLRTLAPQIVVQRSGKGVNVEIHKHGRALQMDRRSRLTLSPSFFCWPGHEAFVLLRPGGLRCEVAYPLAPLTVKAAKIHDPGRRCDELAALGDPARLKIVELLSARDLSTRELAGYVGIDEPATSRHLQTLFRAGLVRRSRSGYFVMYSLHRDALARLTAALSSVAKPPSS